MSWGLTSQRRIMFLAASMEMVMTSSSGEGTDLESISRFLLICSPSVPHTLPISCGVILYRGRYAP